MNFRLQDVPQSNIAELVNGGAARIDWYPIQSHRADFRPGPRVSRPWQTGEGTNETVSILKQANGLMNVESSA